MSMRGSDERSGKLFSYVDLEQRLPARQAASTSNGTEQTKAIRSPVTDGPTFAAMATSKAKSHITMATKQPLSPHHGRVFQQPVRGPDLPLGFLR